MARNLRATILAVLVLVLALGFVEAAKAKTPVATKTPSTSNNPNGPDPAPTPVTKGECLGPKYEQFTCKNGEWYAEGEDVSIQENQEWNGSNYRFEGTVSIYGTVKVVGVNVSVKGQLEIPGDVSTDSIIKVEGSFVMDTNGKLELVYSAAMASPVGVEVSGDALILSSSVLSLKYEAAPSYNYQPVLYANNISGQFTVVRAAIGEADCPVDDLYDIRSHSYPFRLSCGTANASYPFESSLIFEEPVMAPIPNEPSGGPTSAPLPLSNNTDTPGLNLQFFNESSVSDWTKATAIELLMRFNNKLLQDDLHEFDSIKNRSRVEILEGRVNLVAKQIGFLLSVAPPTPEETEHLFADLKKILQTSYNFTASRLGRVTLVRPKNETSKRFNEPLGGNFSDWQFSSYVTVQVTDLPEGPHSNLISIFVTVGVIGTLILVGTITAVVIYRQKRHNDMEAVYKDPLESEGLLDS